MEYVPGKDLRSLLERFRRRKEIMPTAMAVYCATKICEGLDYAHRKKDARGQELFIIHRDVSPQNILISFEGEVKIIDFGIAKAANRSQKTQAGILKGKFGYMSPEQVRGLPIDRRSDIFAVGVIIYEMLTGEKLFVGESDFSTLEKVRNAEVPAPRQFNPNIPAGLEKVVMKALARESEERYQWASDLQEDLMRFLLAGDAIYSGKHLGAFMKDAFAEDVLRENDKMERFAGVEKPDSVDVSSVSAPPRASVPAPLHLHVATRLSLRRRSLLWVADQATPEAAAPPRVSLWPAARVQWRWGSRVRRSRSLPRPTKSLPRWTARRTAP
jgi:eukaryotic-like serine/threonine-protein kinase